MPQIRTADIKDNAVTNAKLATQAAYTIKANNTASTAAPTDITVDEVVEMLELRGKVYSAARIGINLY